MPSPAPAAASTRSVGDLDGLLSSLQLDWQYSDTGQPNLFFMLSAVNGRSVRQEKTLFHINLAALNTPFPALSSPRVTLELVEKETAVRSIPLPRLLSCEPAAGDDHTLQLAYITEAAAATASSGSKGRRAEPKRQSSCQLLSLTFPSLDDAQDVTTILAACIHCGSCPSSSLSPQSASSSPLLAKTINGQLCIHSGWVEKQASSSRSWARRFLRLFPNRLLLYRSPSAACPVNVLPLTTDDLDSHAIVTPNRGARDVAVDLRSMWGQDGREGLLWRCASEADQARWAAALRTEQTASFRTPVGAILTPMLIDALRAETAATAAAAADEPSSRAAHSSAPGGSSWSPQRSRGESLSGFFSGNPLLDASPSSSPPFNGLFASTATLPLTPALALAPPALPAAAAAASPPLSLAALLSSPRSFFQYLLHLSSLPALFPSSLPSVAVFHRSTPQPLFKKRGKLMLAIDQALSSHLLLLSSSACVWAESRLLMVDELEQSGSGQIGFSFPGFDSQVFDVGKLSVVSCGQLMQPALTADARAQDALVFTRSDYASAMESSSPAKEMMQSSPDVAALYSAGQQEEARSLSHRAQFLVLHNCALAAHLRQHTGQSFLHSLRGDDVIPWSAVQRAAASSCSGAAAARNLSLLDAFASTAYIANPSLHSLQLLLSHTMAEKGGAAAPPLSFGAGSGKWKVDGGGLPFSSAPVSPQQSPRGSPLSSVPSSPRLPSRLALTELWHGRRGSVSSGPKREEEKTAAAGRDRASSGHSHSHSVVFGRGVAPAPLRAQDDREKARAAARAQTAGERASSRPERVSPPASVGQSPSSTPPSHSRLSSSFSALAALLGLSLPEDVTEVRPLVNPLHLLLLLRCLLMSRLQSLQRLENVCTDWVRKRREERGHGDDEADGSGAAGGGERQDSVLGLMRKAEDDRQRLQAVLSSLPDYEELERQRELQDREERDAAARNALMRRRQGERERRRVKDKEEEQRLQQLTAIAAALPAVPTPRPAVEQADHSGDTEQKQQEEQAAAPKAEPSFVEEEKQQQQQEEATSGRSASDASETDEAAAAVLSVLTAPSSSSSAFTSSTSSSSSAAAAAAAWLRSVPVAGPDAKSIVRSRMQVFERLN